MFNQWTQGLKESTDIMIKNGTQKLQTPPPSGKGFFHDWWAGIKQSVGITLENGKPTVTAPELPIMDILVVIAMIGVLLKIAGVNKMGNKMVFGGLLGGAIWMVICSV